MGWFHSHILVLSLLMIWRLDPSISFSHIGRFVDAPPSLLSCISCSYSLHISVPPMWMYSLRGNRGIIHCLLSGRRCNSIMDLSTFKNCERSSLAFSAPFYGVHRTDSRDAALHCRAGRQCRRFWWCRPEPAGDWGDRLTVIVPWPLTMLH